MRWASLTVALLQVLAVGCASDGPSASERGEQLFNSKALSSSRLNYFSCKDCHALQATQQDVLIRTGAPLAGAIDRPSFWGGQEGDLLGAVNACRAYFMEATKPLAANDHDADDLYAFLASLGAGNSSAVPFTVVRSIDALPRGDASHGTALYAEACMFCHGPQHTGAGRLGERIPILPEDTRAAHQGYTERLLRLVFTEKIRHGGFFGYSGDMPPFSSEVLSDADISDLLESLGVLGE